MLCFSFFLLQNTYHIYAFVIYILIFLIRLILTTLCDLQTKSLYYLEKVVSFENVYAVLIKCECVLVESSDERSSLKFFRNSSMSIKYFFKSKKKRRFLMVVEFHNFIINIS